LGNGTTVIDASLQPGADFGSKVNAAIAALPATGGTVDARGLGGAQTMSTSIVLGSDSEPVTLLLPVGTITRNAGVQFKYFSGSHVQGQNAFNSSVISAATLIVGTDAADTAFIYGGSSSPAGVILENFAVLDAPEGTNPASGSVSIDFSTSIQGSQINNVWADADVGLLFGPNNQYGCACYDAFSNDNFWGSTYGVKIQNGTNSNKFWGGTYRGSTPVLIPVYAILNTFWHPDIESSGRAFDIYGQGNTVTFAYFEANSANVYLEPGARGNVIQGGTTGTATVTDNSNNWSNYYNVPGDFTSGIGALPPSRVGVSDRFMWSTSGIDDCDTQGAYPNNCGGEHYDLHAMDPANIGVELGLRGGYSITWGLFGHAPFISGVSTQHGGDYVVGQLSVSALGQPAAPLLSCTNQGTGTTYTYYLVAHAWGGGATLPSNVATIQCPNAPSSTNPITIATPAGQIATVAVSSGGSGYAVGNTVGIAPTGWEPYGFGASFTVSSVSSGAVTGLTVSNPGYGYVGYPVQAANLATFTATGSGTGLTVTITPVGPIPDGVYGWDILKGDAAHSIFTNQRCALYYPCQDTGQAAAAYATPTRDSTGDVTLNNQLTLAALAGSTQCLEVNASGIVSGTGTSCGGVTVQTNGINNASQTSLNFQTSTANAVGLTVTPSNPSAGNEKFEVTGGSYSGNAATATALASTPSQCGLNQFATGIAASGNANCAHRVYAIDVQECDSAGMYCASGSSATTTTSGAISSGATSVTLASASSFSAGQGIFIAGGGAVSVVGGTVAYNSGGTASGTGTCIASAANGGGADAVGTFAVSSGTISGNLSLVSGGQSYTTAPTSWTLSTGTATSCSGTVTTTGGTLVAGNYIGIIGSVSGNVISGLNPSIATNVSSGALVQHDETNAFQGAITALSVTGGKILVPDGYYRVNGPLQDTGGANAILNLPKVAVPVVPNTAVPVSIDIEGVTPPANSTYTGIATSGAILQTSVSAGNLIGGLNTASYYTNLTFVFLTLKNLTFRTQNNPAICVVNAYYLAGFTGETLQFDVGVAGVPTQPSYPNGIAISMPSAQSWCTAILRDSQITGYYTGVQAYDHNYLDNIAVFLCLRAVQMNTPSASSYREVVVTKLLIQDCTYGIFAGGAQNIVVYDLSNEAVFYTSPPTGWTNPVALFYDPSNKLSGTVNYSIVGGQSRLTSTGAVLQNGAMNLALNYISNLSMTATPPLGGLTGWVLENYLLGANSTGTYVTQAGQTLTITTPSTGSSLDAGYFTTAYPNFTGHAFVSRVLGTVTGSSSGTGIIVGVSSTNYLALYNINGTLTFEKNGSTVATTTYSPTSDLWWRIRESSGTWYAEVAPDGVTWTNPSSFTTTVTWTYTSGTVAGMEVYTNGTRSGYSQYDQVSIQ
jgi:hypothetical protein